MQREDERKYQGRPHDLLVFDETTDFLVAQVRFLLGWLRSTVPGQRCQALMTFNPPTNAEGRWVIDFFAPWLDKKFPRPAKPGEPLCGVAAGNPQFPNGAICGSMTAALRAGPSGRPATTLTQPSTHPTTLCSTAIAHIHPVADIRQPLPARDWLHGDPAIPSGAAALPDAQGDFARNGG